MNDTFIFSFEHNIDSEVASHNTLSKLASQLKCGYYKQLIIDLGKVTFIAANQFAILGCIFDTYLSKYSNTELYFKNMCPTIQTIIQKNGFGKHFGLGTIPDQFNTVIPYKIFTVNEIKEYESYLTLKLFSRSDLPQMTNAFKHMIQDYLLEVFKNVSDHTSSKYVYSCGQFFPKSSMLYFTIVDNGETIPYNVEHFFIKNNDTPPDNCLKWALQEGTTTSNTDSPRGIGLFLIKQFIQSNRGKLCIISGAENYEFSSHKERYIKLSSTFPGTIVTLAFNLSDSSFYSMSNTDYTEIQF